MVVDGGVVVVGGNQISTFNPSYEIRSNGDGTGDIEFDFYDIELPVQSCTVDDDDEFSFGDYSYSSASPLLPRNHFYSNLSPASRTQVIEQGRKEMMEMIRNMPESTYELSLKDLVDHQLHPVPDPEPEPEEEEEEEKYQKRFHFETEEDARDTKKQNEKKKKKKKRKAGPMICRSASMDADSLKIKMFFPSSLTLSFNKKSAAENSSKVSPTPPCQASQKPPAHKQSWIKRIFFSKKFPRNTTRQGSTNIRTKSRHVKPSSLPACLPFFLSNSKKSKDKRQGDSSI